MTNARRPSREALLRPLRVHAGRDPGAIEFHRRAVQWAFDRAGSVASGGGLRFSP